MNFSWSTPNSTHCYPNPRTPTIYLSTAGKEPDFLEDLALLEETAEAAFEKYPDSVLYIRGDANVSPIPRDKNERDMLLQHFLANNNLQHLPTNHYTYHHFTNDGQSDSSIDVILASAVTSEGFPNQSHETLLKVICGKKNSYIQSSHDAILSYPLLPCSSSPALDNINAPRIQSTKHKIEWSVEGIQAYQELLLHVLPGLQYDDYEDLQAGSASLLFQVTNHILTSAAKQTNKVIDLT